MYVIQGSQLHGKSMESLENGKSIFQTREKSMNLKKAKSLEILGIQNIMTMTNNALKISILHGCH